MAGQRRKRRQRRIRWYNPKLGGFEWRRVPQSDQKALAALDGYPGAEGHVSVYREWRALGASITAALMRAGEAATERATVSGPGKGNWSGKDAR